MLSLEDNKLLTQVSPGTPGGEVIRHYWLPFLLSSELPDRDGIPQRVRLLGEDLIAWRDTNGTVGLVEDYCAHRGASLFFARNEECGLRCVYHGWKYDVTGQCVDMPAEPPATNFRDKICITAYPCVERNGVVWTYMGREATPPPIPHYDWNMVSEDHAFVTKRVQFCNWFQALEGGIDSTHTDFIHASLTRTRVAGLDGAPRAGGADQAAISRSELQMFRNFETVPTDYGVMIANSRPNPFVDGEIIWRVNHFVMPFYTLFPGMSGHAWVPIDDEKTLVFHFNYNPERPYAAEEKEQRQHAGQDGIDGFHLSVESRLPATTEPYGAWIPKHQRSNDYLIDYGAQKTVRFSGIPGGWNQDSAVQESMGRIANRPREHLGTADSGLIAARRYFVKVTKAFRDNQAPPPGLERPEIFRVRPGQTLLPRGADWVTEMKSIYEGAMTEQVSGTSGSSASRTRRGGT